MQVSKYLYKHNLINKTRSVQNYLQITTMNKVWPLAMEIILPSHFHRIKPRENVYTYSQTIVLCSFNFTVGKAFV